MTISSNDDPKAGPYNGNDSQTVFPFSFRSFLSTDLLVVRTDEEGVEHDLVPGSDYSVSLNADQNANPGGSVTYPISGTPLPTGETLTIVSDLEYLQPLNLLNGGAFSPSVQNTAFDRVTMLVKQVKEKVSRALQLAVSTPDGVDVTLPVPEASKVIGWSADGTSLANFAADTSVSTDLFADRLADTSNASNGAGLSGFNWALLYAQNTAGWGARTATDTLNVFRYIPPAQWAAILAGTSTYDATADIQAALNSGAPEVFLPGSASSLTPAQYRTTSVLTKPGTVKLRGGGAYNTAIHAAHNGIIVSFTPGALSGDSYSTMEDLMVRNAATFTSSIGISLANLNQASISRVRVEGCAIGMQLSFVLNSRFSEMTFVNATNIGLYIFSAGLATGNNRNTYKNFNFNSCNKGIRIDGTGTILSAFDDIGIETCTTPLEIVNGNNIVFNRLYLEANTTNISLLGGDKIGFYDCTNVSAQQFINTAGFAAGRVVVRDLYDLSAGGIIVNANVMVYDFGQIRYPSTIAASSNVNTLDAFVNGQTWTPADASGAGLAITNNGSYYTRFGDTVIAFFNITYPATASGANAEIGGLPFPSSGIGGGPVVRSTIGTNSATTVRTTNGNSTFFFESVVHTTPTNANLATFQFVGYLIYRV